MKTPLVFKLILLLVLCWRLIIANKKRILFPTKPYLNLDNYTISEKTLLSQNTNPILAVKQLYRTQIKEDNSNNVNYFLIFLAYKICKIYEKKKGIFNLFWYDQPYVLSFYQSLLKLGLSQDANNLFTILKKISEESTIHLLSNNYHNLLPDIFIPQPGIYDEVFNEFDKQFSIHLYCKSALNYTAQT